MLEFFSLRNTPPPRLVFTSHEQYVLRRHNPFANLRLNFIRSEESWHNPEMPKGCSTRESSIRRSRLSSRLPSKRSAWFSKTFFRIRVRPDCIWYSIQKDRRHHECIKKRWVRKQVLFVARIFPQPCRLPTTISANRPSTSVLWEGGGKQNVQSQQQQPIDVVTWWWRSDGVYYFLWLAEPIFSISQFYLSRNTPRNQPPGIVKLTQVSES